ncbi:ectoine synthase [Nitrosococcus watsonii]|uniref:L-ectoine synthase n=1 Tax=Nitrosococcus watsoni (strain C-113) TaxID=105559 RepID=D8K7G0_NITWC|nr:ectoine synthase [Nitrosococcus watsonii]ADJ28837.1 Ectoine synthase [Nitrosococcus watsonii C-113]
MIVRDYNKAKETDRRVVASQWESVRLLLKSDNMGFSFHITTIYKGAELPMEYKHHLESVYCLSGEGEVETLADGKIYPIRPGVIYILDQNDQHILRAKTEMQMACVFNPPLTGKEVHDSSGAYPLEAEAVTAD